MTRATRRIAWPPLAFVVSAALLAAGCGSSDGAKDGRTSSGSITVDGTEREYRLHRPADLEGPAPLVLVYHGWGLDVGWSQGLGWQQEADRHGFVVAFPVGVGKSFNAGWCCGPAQEQGLDDVAVAHAIVDDVARRVPVDRRRVYATGFSNGGMMSYRLACESDRFAAIGPVAGTQTVVCPRRRPTSILHIHGTADERVPFGGPEGATDESGAAVRPVLAGWRDRMGCAKAKVTSDGPVRRTVSQCPGGREVELLAIRGVDHEWPDRPQGVEATEALWRFFARHRLG